MGSSLQYLSDVVCTPSVKLLQVRCGSQQAKGQARDTENDQCAAFGLYRGSVRATGRHLEVDFVHVWTVRDGRLTSLRQYTDGAAWKETFAML